MGSRICVLKTFLRCSTNLEGYCDKSIKGTRLQAWGCNWEAEEETDWREAAKGSGGVSPDLCLFQGLEAGGRRQITESGQEAVTGKGGSLGWDNGLVGKAGALPAGGLEDQI